MASDCDVNTEWEKRRDAIKQGICTDMLILTTSEDLLLESQAAERSHKLFQAEEDVVQPDAEITVTNCLLMGANLCAEPLFDQASRESGYGLMLIGDAFIGDQKYLTFVRCVVPFVNWDRNYDALSFGMTTFQEISGRKEQVTRHYYFMDSTPCYEKQCGRLFRLANKANVGAYGESDDDENSDPMLNTEADEEEAEDIRAELDNVIQKLYAHIVDDKEEYAETSRDVDKFIIDQAASLDLQNSDQKSLACSEYIVPSFVRSGFDPVDFFDRELNRADEFNETCKKLGTKSGLRLIKKGAAKRRKIISLQPRGQAKVVEQASTTATTVLTKYVFEHTAPLLMNSSRPKVRDENRLELPRVKLARSLRTLETTLISLNERFRTESDGKKEMSLYRSATIRHKHDDKQYVINVGDLIALKDAVTFVRVIRIIAYSRNSIVKDVKFHGPVFVHGTQTAIGDQGLPNELFFGYECESFQVVDVDQPVTVHRVPQLTPEEFQSFDSRQMLDRYLKPVAYCAA
uniref:Uncharacterized protein n=1 Tax=Plectus sambesii TaxID=2011161 RepID=A0A914WZ55_9BILA